MKIGGETKRAILILKNGAWTFNENAPRENLLKLFVSNHFNEALNPSIYVAGLRSFVRRTVEKQSCKLWRERFPEKTRADYETETRALELWRGEDYGFRNSGKFITIANACFNADEKDAETGAGAKRDITKKKKTSKRVLNIEKHAYFVRVSASKQNFLHLFGV